MVWYSAGTCLQPRRSWAGGGSSESDSKVRETKAVSNTWSPLDRDPLLLSCGNLTHSLPLSLLLITLTLLILTKPWSPVLRTPLAPPTYGTGFILFSPPGASTGPIVVAFLPHAVCRVNNGEYPDPERWNCICSVTKTHREIWRKATCRHHHMRGNCNRFTNTGCSLSKTQWMSHNV